MNIECNLSEYYGPGNGFYFTNFFHKIGEDISKCLMIQDLEKSFTTHTTNMARTSSYASFLYYYITKMSFWCTSISKWKHIIKVVMMSASFGWSASLVEMWSGYIIFRRSNMTIYVPPYVYLYILMSTTSRYPLLMI